MHFMLLSAGKQHKLHSRFENGACGTRSLRANMRSASSTPLSEIQEFVRFGDGFRPGDSGEELIS